MRIAMNQQNHTGISFSPILILLLAAVVAGGGGSPAPAAAPTQAPAATQAPTAAPAPTTAPARTTAPAPNSAPSPTPQPVALTFAFPDDAASAAASMAQIQAYTREHPEVQIT